VVKLDAKIKKYKAKELADKKRTRDEDPGQKILRKKERHSAREVHFVTTKLARKFRRQARENKFALTAKKKQVIKNIARQEAKAEEVIKEKAERLGIPTPPTVHFKVPIPEDDSSIDDEINKEKPHFAPVKFASLEEVRDAKVAFAPGAADKVAEEAAAMSLSAH